MPLKRSLGIANFQIDANVINGLQLIPEMNQLEKWYEDGVIIINMSSIARDEAMSIDYQPRIKKANAQIFTINQSDKGSSIYYDEVANALFPTGVKDQNQINDVLIVCDAIKFNANLITQDGCSKKQPGGILGNRKKLVHRLRIFSAIEAVEFVKAKIIERDLYSVEYIKNYGGTLPPWHAKD